MPTVVRRHPRRGHFSRLAAGQLFQILIAEPGNGHIFGDQPPRFLLPARLLFEARVFPPTAGFAQGGFPDSQDSLGKCLAAPSQPRRRSLRRVSSPSRARSSNHSTQRRRHGHLPKGQLTTVSRRNYCDIFTL